MKMALHTMQCKMVSMKQHLKQTIEAAPEHVVQAALLQLCDGHQEGQVELLQESGPPHSAALQAQQEILAQLAAQRHAAACRTTRGARSKRTSGGG